MKKKNQAANPAGFRDLIMVAGGFNLLSVGGALPTTLYSLYQKRFHFSEITLTLIFAAYVVGTLTTLMFFGRLSDQIGRSRSVLIAVGLAFLSTLVFIFARDIPMLFIGRVFSGASVGLGAGALTAWLEELHAEAERSTLWAAGANILGLGLGPLMTGLLVSFAPLRFRLTYIVFLALLALVVWMARSVRETVKDPVRHAADISFRPRFGLPREKRRAFFPPAAATFCSYAMMGYYTALAPSLLAHSLHMKSPAVAGAIIFEAFLIGALVIMALAFLSPVGAMLAGLATLLPALALLVLAERMHSLMALLIATALAGIGVALGYRGSLQRVNGIAPDDGKAEIVSTYLLFSYAGISLPVIGIGVISRLASRSAADLTFAVIIACLAAAAFLFELTNRDKSRSS